CRTLGFLLARGRERPFLWFGLRTTSVANTIADPRVVAACTADEDVPERPAIVVIKDTALLVRSEAQSCGTLAAQRTLQPGIRWVAANESRKEASVGGRCA